MNDRPILPSIAIGAAILAALAIVGMWLLAGRIADVEAENERLQAELVRVEEGAASAALQTTLLTSALNEQAPEISRGLSEAISGLESFAGSTIAVNVDVSESVEVDASFAINREIVVPVRTSIPVQETIETTIVVAGPLNTELPLDVTVPIDLEFPVELDVPITVDEEFPVAANVPIAVTVPLEIRVAETELATMATSLGEGLAALQAVLDALAGP